MVSGCHDGPIFAIGINRNIDNNRILSFSVSINNLSDNLLIKTDAALYIWRIFFANIFEGTTMGVGLEKQEKNE